MQIITETRIFIAILILIYYLRNWYNEKVTLENLENIKSEIVDIIKVIEYNDAIEDGNEEGDLNISLLRGIEMGKKSQWRYDFITKKGMSRETWAGIRDMILGEIKNGKHIGLSIILSQGTNSGSPHININPRGINSRKNPHISLIPGLATGAYYFQKALETAGKAFSILQIVRELFKMYDAVNKDIVQYYSAEKNFGILKNSVEDLRTALDEDKILTQSVKSKYEEFLGDCHEYVDLLYRNRNILPENVIKAGGSFLGGVAGGIAGAYVGGAACTWIFAIVLGFVGLGFGGPAGVMVGSLIGTVVGRMVGSIVGTLGVEWTTKMGLDYYFG